MWRWLRRLTRARERVVTLRQEHHGRDVRTLEARLLDSGDLVIEGQDLGPIVEKVWGDREYEWTITIPARALPGLAAALGGSQHEANVLRLLAARVAEDERYATREFLQEHRIPHDFWNRVGD